MNKKVKRSPQTETELEISLICSLKIKGGWFQCHKHFQSCIITALCCVWQHSLSIPATDYKHVIYIITQERNPHQSLLLRDWLNYIN